MKLFARALLVAIMMLAVATAVTSLAPQTQARSPYASALSLAGVEEAQAVHHPLGPGCQRACSSTGCVWIANRPSTCYVMSAESCVEEPCQ